MTGMQRFFIYKYIAQFFDKCQEQLVCVEIWYNNYDLTLIFLGKTSCRQMPKTFQTLKIPNIRNRRKNCQTNRMWQNFDSFFRTKFH